MINEILIFIKKERSEMKMKKILCIALVLMMAFGAVACGGDDNVDEGAAKIKLGGIGPLTGRSCRIRYCRKQWSAACS